MNKEIQVGFVGNPNIGKTTLFNAYTGANLKVANWPGVTVEKIEGFCNFNGCSFRLVDLPGIYSLTSYTMEERLTREYILNSDVDVIINIVDASSLERNLYLTLQLIELGKPVVLALNMMDIVEERGMKINLVRLEKMLGVPVVPVSARKRMGLDILMNTVMSYRSGNDNKTENQGQQNLQRMSILNNSLKNTGKIIRYNNITEEKIKQAGLLLKNRYGDIDHLRWHAIKVLEMDEAVLAKYPVDAGKAAEKSYEENITNQKYDYIEKVVDDVLINKNSKSAVTDKADRFLTHRYFGIPIFFLIMAIIFFLTFKVGDLIKGVFEAGLELFSNGIHSMLDFVGAGEFVTSLVVEGIIAGVGTILTFLPNIFILFLALAFLEDSGYMSRVAYVMDGIMGKIGLSGKAFIPMLLGFGCSVPAIMSTRSLENMQDRSKAILITPFMSCSARLTIYVLFSKMFFGRMAMLTAYSMYLIGILAAIVVAYIFNKNTMKGNGNALLIELPEYKTPNTRTIMIYVWEKVKEYLTKAGTTIFAASVTIWFILNFGPHGMVSDMSESFGAMIGKMLAPLLAPAGLGMWQVVVALISGIAAKEVVVSSFSVLFGIGNITTQQGMAGLTGILSDMGFKALNAYSLMVFSLLYIPCAATIGVIRRELRSTAWTVFIVLFQLGVAMLVSTLVYQIGSLFVD